jgi:hypothetical protein
MSLELQEGPTASRRTNDVATASFDRVCAWELWLLRQTRRLLLSIIVEKPLYLLLPAETLAPTASK